MKLIIGVTLSLDGEVVAFRDHMTIGAYEEGEAGKYIGLLGMCIDDAVAAHLAKLKSAVKDEEDDDQQEN